ncbi:hypothetical protein L5515_002904 [Caenorhabditis briggsae]|uniref:Ubiquitin-like protease family profile domain-containing protein n=1 Tax=Caenorhabditis briggsae TaxID=6238 RepID=A0AAE9EDC6_CAEBR|nr:hypothetical protein L5515_002904 [Caenorhabditis briggsae]
MGRLEYIESSSDDVGQQKDGQKGDEVLGNPKESADVRVIERLSTGGDLQEEVKFGEQLQDDLINSFCDKLQAVCPRRLEAFMAIQFLMITDVADIRKHVTGKSPAMQVLYDRTRSHYVLVHYNAKHQKVEIYDSLQPWKSDGTPEILTELSTHISHLFGHLFTKYIPCLVDREYEAQSDNFSCGYRVLGALVDLARQKNPSTQRYSRTSILEFMRAILAEPNPTWQMFETAKFGKVKEYSGDYRASIYLLNSTYTTSSSSSSTLSGSSPYKRTASTDSLVSQKSGSHSDGSSYDGRKNRKHVRRAHAGRNQQTLFAECQPNHGYRSHFGYHQNSGLMTPSLGQPFVPIAYRYPSYVGPPPYHVSALPRPQPTVEHGLLGYVRNGYQMVVDSIFHRKSESEDVEPDRGHE